MSYSKEVFKRLRARSLELPKNPPPPAGEYAAYRLHAGFGFLAAQTSGYDGRFRGSVGDAISTEQGRLAAQTAALDALSRIHQALSGFDRLVSLLHVAGHVASAPGFFDQPEVLDGASRLFNDVLGERGRHSRTAYAVPQLPKRITVELEITFAYDACAPRAMALF